MRKPNYDATWPAAWKLAYEYDREEVFGPGRDRGYANAYDSRRRAVLTMLSESVPARGTVLDVAAAQGNFTLQLAEMGYEVTWNDLRKDLADYVKLKMDRELRVHFAPGNVYDMTFARPFDAVLIAEIIEHVAHPDQFLTYVATLVKPGGVIVMSTPNGGYLLNRLPRWSECLAGLIHAGVQFAPNSDGHIFLLHEAEIRSLARLAGLVVERHLLFSNPLTTGHLGMRLLLPALSARTVRSVETATHLLPQALQRRLFSHSATRFRTAAQPEPLRTGPYSVLSENPRPGYRQP